MSGASCACSRRVLLLLLLLLAAGDVLQPVRAQATLRAPGAPTNDGRIVIGGTSINGKPAFLAQYQSIFTDYLNAALGATLGKTFVTVAVDIDETVGAVAGSQLDFVFSYPSLFTCFSAQFGARVIASVQSSRRVTTPPYAAVPLSFFGGVFFTLANRSDINSLADIAGKRLEGADVTSMAAGQAQWYELMLRGMSFWNLPSQMVFTGNQYTVIADVFAGRADIGMVRTDLLEGLQLPPPFCNATAEAAVGLACYPAGTFKIIEPRAWRQATPSTPPRRCGRSGRSPRWRTWMWTRRRRWRRRCLSLGAAASACRISSRAASLASRRAWTTSACATCSTRKSWC